MADKPPRKPPDPVDDRRSPLIFTNENGLHFESPPIENTGNSVNSAKKRHSDQTVVNADSDKRHRNNNDIESSVSAQSIYTHLSFTQQRTYSQEDTGPFIVHISRVEPDAAAGTTLRSIKFGQFLHKNRVHGIVRDGVKNVGRNRISVQFKSAAEANSLVSSVILSNNNYKAMIPTYNVTRMGIVRGIPVDWSMDELVESLDLPDNCGIVLKARRLNRKNTENGTTLWKPTQTVVLTFAGQRLPDRIYSFNSSLIVETYQMPTIQCHNCCRFGHVKSQCRSQPRCYRCAQNHNGDSCEVLEFAATCLLCSGNHFATSKCCPEQSRQRGIKILMSQESISYIEASARLPQAKRPYNEVVKEPIMSLPLSYSSPSNSQYPIPSMSSSYRKTVTSSPHRRIPIIRGYDRQAHQSLVSTPPSMMPNGCGLLQSPPDQIPEDRLLETTVSLLTIVLSKFNDALPSNVRNQLEILFKSVPLESRHNENKSGESGDGLLQVPSMEL